MWHRFNVMEMIVESINQSHKLSVLRVREKAIKAKARGEFVDVDNWEFDSKEVNRGGISVNSHARMIGGRSVVNFIHKGRFESSSNKNIVNMMGGNKEVKKVGDVYCRM